jgi:hypothetical protein
MRMRRMGKSCRKSSEDIHDESRAWRVVDDLARDQPVDPAELDAAEAFLMPVVGIVTSGKKRLLAASCLVDLLSH